jgi:transaldolase
MDAIRTLTERGVAIWLDTLSRELVDDGHLARLASDLAVSGATSNPTIFAAAICESDRYDAQLRALLDAGVDDAKDLFPALATEDVRRAARVMRPLYDATNARHGFVSIECTPDVAHDADATVAQALELFDRLDAPNVMIKVPATDAGVEAIEDLTVACVNVNVTLLFSLARYEQVIEAYVRGLERRAQAGRPVEGIASVASFFVSRVDAEADRRLAAGSPLRGRVGIANARAAYARYLERFGDARWQRLADLGATPQRPLWASTATKDPAYRDTMYLEQLALPGTILTVPAATLGAFADHGDPGRTSPFDAAAAERALATATGVGLFDITAALERKGIEAFCDSYRELLDCIDRRACALRASRTRPRPALARAG